MHANRTAPPIRAAFVIMFLILLPAFGGFPAFAADAPDSVAPTPAGNPIIADGCSVALEYTLTLDEDGTVADSNVGGPPLTYTQGAHQIIPGLETAMTGLKTGDEKKVTIAPADAYGPVHREAFIEVELERLPEEARKTGARIQGHADNGRVVTGLITEVKEKTATVDFNHPLAGKTLHFAVKVLNVAAAETTAPEKPAAENAAVEKPAAE
ncbi:MAG: FKBP-type peptidyl-prolyl cis-trans isomerase, partial [Deltaproteobacteria bacterium]|nr:FKBP-type peptidyl-prolyl cis-trans isomerase [Candidatus Anaeroferrophillacea bacterium]